MKINIYLVVVIKVLLFHAYMGLYAEPLKFAISSESAILINAETGAVLFEKEATKLIYPASTTKIASVLYALKVKGQQLNEMYVADQECLGTVTHETKRKAGYKLPAYRLEPDGTSISLKKGEAMSLRDLLAGAMIVSGNDAANVFAHGISKNIPTFMDQVNLYLKQIGCRNTRFLNPHGLHHPDHQTTAQDLAIMAREALKEPFFREIVMRTRFIRPKTNMQASSTHLALNLLVRSGKYHYSKAIGIKTGYHAKAKSVLVAAAESDHRTLIAVMTGNPERKQMFVEVVKLFEMAFNQPKVRRTYIKAGRQSFSKDMPQASHPLQTYLPNDLSLEYYPAEDPLAKCQLIWRELELPIRKNQVVADLQLIAVSGIVLKQTQLLATDAIGLSWPYNGIRKMALFYKNYHDIAWFLTGLFILSLAFTGWVVIRR